MRLLHLWVANCYFTNNIKELAVATFCKQYYSRSTGDVFFLLFELLSTLAKLARPDGSRSVIAENLFRAESITLKTHWVMVVMDQYTRRIIGFAVHAGNVDGLGLCRMFNDAASGQNWPQRVSSDNDPLFQCHRWKANLHVLDVEEIKSLPHVPMSHPFVERLIGSVRRELLDQTLFWTGTDLENKLCDYQAYYNEHRCHAGRDGATPDESGRENFVALNDYRWKKHCRGLFQLPVAA